MNHPSRRPCPLALLLGVLLSLLPDAQAKMSVWQDLQGTEFRGEASGILGPFAIFRTSGGRGRRVLFRALSPEDCVRFYREIATLPARAGSLAGAKGQATGELPGRVLRVRQQKLVPAELAARPEPEILLVLSGSNNSSDGWFMAGNLQQFYRRVQRVYPGFVEGVFLGARHDVAQHQNMAVQSGMPWLVADLRQQGAMMGLRDFIPGREGTNVVLVSRHGVPLVAGPAGESGEVQTLVDQMSELLWQIDPANPAGWSDRVYYLQATRPVEFAQARDGPVLVGNPLRAEVLRKYGVKRVAARLEVAADGRVAPQILSGPADVPAQIVAALATALAQAVVVPAVDQGKPVAGTLEYRLEVPPADPVREAEQVWLGSSRYPVLPIAEWLVLRPIKVPEQDFGSSVIGEQADGTVILNPFEVNSGKVSRAAQMSAFNSDWFAGAGPDSVRPREGERQQIDAETELTWEKVRSRDGFVEMQKGTLQDYVVGYAWAEIESPRDTPAWLGLGSDDGVKIWLNGELVHDKWIRRPSRVDDDVVPLQLRKGPNRMLIKIQNATIHWSFTYRLRLKP